MIARPKNRGQPVLRHPGPALSPISAVTTEDSNPSLLPKQDRGLGPKGVRGPGLQIGGKKSKIH